MTKRRTAAEIIGFHFGWDIRDVSETRYQSTRYTAPAVYVIGDDYYAAPADNRRSFPKAAACASRRLVRASGPVFARCAG